MEETYLHTVPTPDSPINEGLYSNNISSVAENLQSDIVICMDYRLLLINYLDFYYLEVSGISKGRKMMMMKK